MFTRADCSVKDLIRYSVDRYSAAEKLYDCSDRSHWEYVHSAAFLSHQSIELLLKACILCYEKEFPAVHDLKRLFRQLRKKEINLSDQNKKWLNYLNNCNALRYPDMVTRTEVDINQWGKTKALFEELRANVPKEIQRLIIRHERYRSNVKSGKTIYPENKGRTTAL